MGERVEVWCFMWRTCVGGEWEVEEGLEWALIVRKA
jgi:hypothetical protein